MSTRQGLRRSSRLQQLQRQQQTYYHNERTASAPSLSLPTAIPSSAPSPHVPIPLSEHLQSSQSDGSTLTAPRRRRKNAPTVVSSSPAKRQRCFYNLRSSSKKTFPSASLVPTVTPKHISFEKEADVFDIYSCPLVKEEDPALVWSYQHFTAYGATYLQHQRQKENRECNELYGTIGPYPSCAVVDAYTLDEDEWKYRGDDETAIEHERYEYRQRILALKEVVPLDVSTRLPKQPMITAKMRAILVNWLVEVATEYSVSNTAFHLGVTLLDAYLAKGDPDSRYEALIVYRSEFQALGCACLWIASKMEDKTPPEIEDLAYISDHSFSQSKLIEIEQRVCKTLGFCLHRVTPHHYLDTFLKASQAGDPPHPMLLTTVEYLLELGRLSFEISYRPPSLVAAAALYLARATIGITHKGGSYWSPTLLHVTQYSLEEIEDTVLMLHKYQLMASESKELGAIYSKYRKRTSLQVASKVPPRFDSLAIDFDVCGKVQYEYTTISRT